MNIGYKYNSLINNNNYIGNDITVFNNVDMTGATLLGFPVDNTSIRVVNGLLSAEGGYTSDISTEYLYVNHIYNLSNSDNTIHYHDTLSGNYLISSDIRVEEIHSLGDLHINSNNGIGTTFIENDLYGYSDILNDGITWSNGYRSKVGETKLYSVGVYNGSSINIYTDGGIKLLSASDKYINANGVLVDYYNNISNINSLTCQTESVNTLNATNIFATNENVDNLTVDTIISKSGTSYVDAYPGFHIFNFNSAGVNINQYLTASSIETKSLYSTDIFSNYLNSSSVWTNLLKTDNISSQTGTVNMESCTFNSGKIGCAQISTPYVFATDIQCNNLSVFNNIYASHIMCSDFSTNAFSSSSIQCNSLSSLVGSINTLTSTDIYSKILTSSSVNANIIITDTITGKTANANLTLKTTDANGKIMLYSESQLINSSTTPRFTIYSNNNSGTSSAYLTLKRGNTTTGFAGVQLYNTDTAIWSAGLSSGDDNYHISATGDALLLNKTTLDASFGGNVSLGNGYKVSTNKIESIGTSDIFISNTGGTTSNGIKMTPLKTLYVDYIKQAGSSDMSIINTTSVSNSALTLSSTTGGLALSAASNKDITLTSLGTGTIYLTGNCSTSGTHNFNGVITAVSGISYSNSTSGYSPTTLTYYEETSQAITGAGAWTGTLTFYIIRVGSLVSITWKTGATFTAVATSSITFTSIPARFRPSAEKRFIYQATVNNNGAAAVLTLSSAGVFTFYASASGSNWTSGLANNIIQGNGISYYYNI